jgi:hypothetical protein
VKAQCRWDAADGAAWEKEFVACLPDQEEARRRCSKRERRAAIPRREARRGLSARSSRSTPPRHQHSRAQWTENQAETVHAGAGELLPRDSPRRDRSGHDTQQQIPDRRDDRMVILAVASLLVAGEGELEQQLEESFGEQIKKDLEQDREDRRRTFLRSPDLLRLDELTRPRHCHRFARRRVERQALVAHQVFVRRPEQSAGRVNDESLRVLGEQLLEFVRLDAHEGP